MRVTIPPQLRQMLERPINELCGQADDIYRKTSRRAAANRPPDGGAALPPAASSGSVAGVAVEGAGLALRAAAMHAGEYEPFLRIIDSLRQQAPEVAESLGLHH
jgi:hypothetical protein